MTALLEAMGLCYPGRLAACDLALDAGSLTVLVGPNGAGKTSLLHAIAGIGASTGSTFVGGERFAMRPGVGRARLLSYLSATRDLPWPLAALDFVALGWPALGAAERAREVLASVEADMFAGRRIDLLSTGERSRVMLARALVAGSRVILLDEPIANLDPRWQIAILERLRREADRGVALLVSVHDLDVARHHADRVIVMDHGAIIADDGPEAALTADIVTRVFQVALSNGRWIRA